MYKIHSYIAQDKIDTKTLSHDNVDSHIQNLGKINVLCIKKGTDFSPSTTTATWKRPQAIPQHVWALGKGTIAPLGQWTPGSAMHHLPSGSAFFLLTGLCDLSKTVQVAQGLCSWSRGVCKNMALSHDFNWARRMCKTTPPASENHRKEDGLLKIVGERWRVTQNSVVCQLWHVTYCWNTITEHDTPKAD